MGKLTTKWFRAIFGLNNNQKAKKWSFGKKSKESSDSHCKKPTQNDAVVAETTNNHHNMNDDESGNHAIAEAEAALAGRRQKAAYVSRGGAFYVRDANLSREDWAAVVVQSHFRGYLARRALRALKGLVKLQALVRGHLIRKQTAYTLRRLQALIRAQVRVRTERVMMMSESPHSSRKSSPFSYARPATPEKSDHGVRARNTNMNEQLLSLKRNGSKMKHNQEKLHTTRTRTSYNNRTTWEHESRMKTPPIYDENTDKILNIDTMNQIKRLSSDQQRCQSFSTSKESITHQSVRSSSSAEIQSRIRYNPNINEAAFYTADNSPRVCSSSSSIGGYSNSCRRDTQDTPTKSDGTRSCFSNYSSHPSYMAFTESSKAKVRSSSTPKQRPQFERSSSTNRYSVHGDSRPSSRRALNSHANFASKGYPGSGRLDRLGVPVRNESSEFSGGLWHRY